ncbi:inner-membrane translocator [Thermincola ferriacetica]|uniref:Inner-membrane translocator n=1 Tax=Thermincola ferriacetica TaxID=281456 RepID=A0A0L6W0F7_9FIRM|nr:urea ABC transporter permease subunit UrtC [Thermincola ferriacetica]KNZ68936.1 inner-membrane translocator [Thermincola ferriacetica]
MGKISKHLISWENWLFVFTAFLLLAVAPLTLSEFRLNLLGKFLAYAILALGIDLIWGYTGILSLGHGVYFGLGAYSMAMYLKLEASGGQLPDFMSWSGLTELPWFWKPFQHAWFAVPMTIILPVTLAVILGFLTFRNRIKGVYFSILSQALAIIFVTLFIGQQPYTGGTNGLTSYKTIFGFSLASSKTQMTLYTVTVLVLGLAFLFCRGLTRARFGRILMAIRDGENRVRFTGYDPTVYKVFVYAVSAALAGIAGALFVTQVGIISPAMMGIVPSIEMAVWVAVGGRGTLVGAVVGAILVNAAKSSFSETFPDAWSYFIGALFVGVVLLFPDGMMGLLKKIRGRFEASGTHTNTVQTGTINTKEGRLYGGYDTVLGKRYR